MKKLYVIGILITSASLVTLAVKGIINYSKGLGQMMIHMQNTGYDTSVEE